MLTGLAHTAVCVPDVEEAVRWYSEVLGLRLLSPPYTMQGAQIEHDMGELVPPPVLVTAAIVGFGKDDRVIELIEYPAAGIGDAGRGDPSVTRVGITHVGVVCDDLVANSRKEASLSSRRVLRTSPGSRRPGATIRGAPSSSSWKSVTLPGPIGASFRRHERATPG